MAAGTFTLYNNVAKYLGDGTVNLTSDTFKITLHTSSYTPAGTQDLYTDLTNELSTANGYTNGGATLASVVESISAGVANWTSANQVWTASGGSITARYAVIRDTTASKLIGYMVLDATPADVTATDGNTLTVGPNASNGWFQRSVNA
jgi:hypothetical protein